MSTKFPSVACMYFILQVTKKTRKKHKKKDYKNKGHNEK